MSNRYTPIDAPVVRPLGGELLLDECPICGASLSQNCSMPDGTEYSMYIHEDRLAKAVSHV